MEEEEHEEAEEQQNEREDSIFFCERSFSFWTCRTGVCVGLKKRDKKRAKQDPRNRSVTRGKSEEDLAVVIAVTRALSRKSKRTQKHTNTDARIKSLSTSGQTIAQRHMRSSMISMRGKKYPVPPQAKQD